MQDNVKAFALAILVALVTPSMVAYGQGYPARPVHITSPYSTSAGPDLVARLFADRLAQTWKQPVIVESKPGGSGIAALESVKRASPDGYELVIAGDPQLAINPSLLRNLPYDPIADFTPVALLYRTPFFVMVATNGPFKALGDLLDVAKRDSRAVSSGIQYVGSASHLGVLRLDQMLGTHMLHVAFKENSQIFSAILNGDLQWAFATMGSSGAFYRSGRIKALAVSSAERMSGFADIPTFREAGGPPFELNAWAAFFGPRGMAAETVTILNREINRLLHDAVIQERLASFGFVPAAGTPQSLGELLQSDFKRNGELIRTLGLQPE